MTPSEIANNALQATLETVQSLMKRCMKLKESDPGTLNVSDEIARRLYWEHSKAGIFVSLPDWKTVIDDDPRIRSHPRFHKTSGLPPLHLARTQPLHVGVSGPGGGCKTSCRIHPCNDAGDCHLTPVLQTLEVPVMEPMVSDIRSSAADTTAWEALTPLPHSIAPVMVRHNIPMVGGMKTQPETASRPRKTKRKAEESDNDGKEAEVLSGLTPTPISQKPIRKRKKKFMSDEEDHRAAGTIVVKHKALSVKTFNVVAPDATSAGTSAPGWLDDRGFWDEETRPAGWGLDSNIATTVEQSVRYHSRKCDKCVKLKVPCVVLPDKKFGFTRLACANCDEMKIACTIDGAGVRQRLQVKAKEAVGEANINPLPKRPRTRANKSRPAAKSLEKSAPAKTTKPATCSNSRAAQTVAVDDTLNEQPTRPKYEAPLAPHNMGSSDLSTPSEAALPAIVSIPAPFQPSLPTNLSEPEPSGRDILRSIQDLGRRFDLLATNERVDVLDVRVDSVEDRFGWRLMELEKQITASDARWHPGSSNDSKYKLQNAAIDERLGISTVGREQTYACN
ncbi:uncharacterized protein F5147DRAFT_655864 [Suillus discolor]|uniref:Uncharacterized protein n=1 Tax=Suillus discolor TaxID=1912936 RepID=A0A9P7JQM4_9AGAM|nr:uncharacterized protein F5147DRAFT_655864 [Suillus discolor]KAG2099265.1 hypothetical protein F5147DRAFT_655864 [Suillus discolor]